MTLTDKIDFYGIFTVKSFDKDDNVIDEYTDKNLIMDSARNNMAQLIGGVTTGTTNVGLPINRFVLGTRGHVGTNILQFQPVGSEDTTKPAGDRLFNSARHDLFSEAIAGNPNYRVSFTATGGTNVTVNGNGVMYSGNTVSGSSQTGNTINRVVTDKVVTYTITIPAQNGNIGSGPSSTLAYTEAALYAGTDIFSMKTFPARVKEDTVKFEITWALVF